MKKLFKFFVGGFALIGFLLVAMSVAGWSLILSRKPPTLPPEMVLVFDLRNKIPESAGSGPLPINLNEDKQSLRDVVATMDMAAMDDRVKTVVARFRNDIGDYAAAQEIREAVKNLRGHGKMTYAVASTFGELGPADKAYYTAAAFERIWLQPIGLVGITGMAAQSPFFRGSLDKLGIQPDFLHREEYKTATDMFMEHDFTPANAEMLGSILDDMDSQVATDIAHDRGIAPIDYYRLTDQAPLNAQTALDAKLVDKLGYGEDVIDNALAGLSNQAEVIDADKYSDMRRNELKAKLAKNLPAVAYIHAVGEISQNEGLGRHDGISADEMGEAIEQAVKNSNMEAILIRLDSPGGSAVASESIRYALSRASKAGLPIVVSMGNMAGSGAYWLSTEADVIVADPATLTGSIGVIAGKASATDEAWDKLGINWGMITRGENADMWTVTQPFTPEQHAKVDGLVGEVYDNFKQRVSDGRELDPAFVATIAKGRVWTGNQAYELGLVDEVGSFDDALAITKSLIGVSEDDNIQLKKFPEEPGLFKRLFKSVDRFGGLGAEMERFVTRANAYMQILAPVTSALGTHQGGAVMPDLRIE